MRVILYETNWQLGDAWVVNKDLKQAMTRDEGTVIGYDKVLLSGQ